MRWLIFLFFIAQNASAQDWIGPKACYLSNSLTKCFKPIAATSGGTGLTVGTSGGIPYFNATTTMASSALLTANGVVLGGGAGAAPTSTAAGTNGQLLVGVTSSAPAWGNTVSALSTFSGGISRSGDDGVGAYHNTTQALTAATLAPVLFNTELVDVTSAFASNTYTCKIAGNYRASFCGYINKSSGSSAAGDAFNVSIRKNSTNVADAIQIDASSTSTPRAFCQNIGVAMAVNDTLDATLVANFGGGRTYVGILDGATFTVERF